MAPEMAATYVVGLVPSAVVTGRTTLVSSKKSSLWQISPTAKHAIVGDSRYGDPKYNEKMAKIYGTDRMFLHAFRLSLVIEGKTETFEASLPEEFEKLLI